MRSKEFAFRLTRLRQVLTWIWRNLGYSEVLWIEFQARLLTNSNKLKHYNDGYSEPNLRLLEMKNNEIYTFTANCKIIVKLSNTN